MADSYLVTLLVKLGVVASLASILVRWSPVKRMLLRETRTMAQRIKLSLWFSFVFGASVATRVVSRSYLAVDLGLEGSLLAGLIGGYVTGLASGVFGKEVNANETSCLAKGDPYCRFEMIG